MNQPHKSTTTLGHSAIEDARSLGSAFTSSKVPEVTIFFWIIKVLCTTVGETAADYLAVGRHYGLVKTSVVTFLLLASALAWQLAAKRYVPWRYWLTVTLVSVFGTLVTDNLTDGRKIALTTSTVVFSFLLVLAFLAWYAADRTLSIHSILTRRREGFYWLAVFVSFALGTASGDLMAERLGFGYLVTGLMLAGVIAVVALLSRLRMNSVLSFWIVYILTRPLGASIGDYLSQPRAVGGRGLGTTITSFIFLGAIAAVVAYLTISKTDVLAGTKPSDERIERHGLIQTIAVAAVVVVVSLVGYNARKNTLAGDTSVSITAAGGATQLASAGATKLGDLTSFRTITVDTISLLQANKQSDATSRIGDLETAWDVAQARLKARDNSAWMIIDAKIDVVLRSLRAANPNTADQTAALNDLLGVLK